MHAHDLQVTFPPPYFGYDFNWALFGYGYNAANLTHNGAISSEYVISHSPAQYSLGMLARSAPTCTAACLPRCGCCWHLPDDLQGA